MVSKTLSIYLGCTIFIARVMRHFYCSLSVDNRFVFNKINSWYCEAKFVIDLSSTTLFSDADGLPFASKRRETAAHCCHTRDNNVLHLSNTIQSQTCHHKWGHFKVIIIIYYNLRHIFHKWNKCVEYMKTNEFSLLHRTFLKVHCVWWRKKLPFNILMTLLWIWRVCVKLRTAPLDHS